MRSSRLAGVALGFMALTPLIKADIIASLGHGLRPGRQRLVG